MLHKALSDWVTNYPKSPTLRDGSFKGALAADILKKKVPEAIKLALGNQQARYKIVGSAGKGDWTYTPWVAVMDPLEATSVEDGIYIVYLLSYGCDRLYLTINQGCTTLKNNAGFPIAREELLRRASLMRDRTARKAKRLKPTSIDLNTNIWRAQLYSKGTIFSCKYDTGKLPDNESLVADLHEAVMLYAAISGAGGHEADDKIILTASSELGKITLRQAKKYRQHRRIERDSNHSKIVKKLQGTRCKGCDVDPVEIYGDIASGMVDAHHLTPLSKLQDGETVEFDPLTDFAILCPSCHRVMHRMKNPGDLDGLRRLINNIKSTEI